MSDVAALLQGLASLLWVVVAVAVVWVLRPIVTAQQDRLTKMSVSASGVSVEFAAAKIAEAQARSGTSPDQSGGGQAARRTVATTSASPSTPT